MKSINIGTILRNLPAITKLEGEILLAYVLGVPRTHLHAWPEQLLSETQKNRFDSLVARRLSGEPLAYILGYKEFWSLTLTVSDAVLVPRPETELLVEQVLAHFPSLSPGVRVLDLGTGSGAIALALGSERPSWKIVAVDSSLAALEVAKQNAKNLLIKNVEFYISEWFSNILIPSTEGEAFQVIVSNPPYLAPNDQHLSGSDLPFEPRDALVSEPDGLEDFRKIIQEAIPYLVSKGWLMLEHGFEQKDEVLTLMEVAGFIQIHHYKDLAGLNRVTVGQKP